jgi:hypothetical protein
MTERFRNGSDPVTEYACGHKVPSLYAACPRPSQTGYERVGVLGRAFDGRADRGDLESGRELVVIVRIRKKATPLAVAAYTAANMSSSKARSAGSDAAESVEYDSEIVAVGSADDLPGGGPVHA